MKAKKSSDCTKPKLPVSGIFVLVFFLSILVFNFSALGQQPPVRANQRFNTLQQPANQRIRIPANLLQLQLVTVPPLVGRNYNFNEISALLDSLGLQMGKAVPVANNDRIGIVISQSPEARQRVRPQTAVDVTYGIRDQAGMVTARPFVIVPDYLRMNIDQALGRIPNDRLSRGPYSEIFSDQPVGEVVEQFPPAGSNVAPNTPVTFRFSSGPQPVIRVRVPRLIGLSLQEAAEVLGKTRLFAGPIKAEISAEKEGTVIGQSPEEGTAVEVGSAINMNYSVRAHEVLVVVPDVTGRPLEMAHQMLKDAGLQVDQIYHEKSTSKEGTVISQRPTGGEKVPQGTPVFLVVAQHAHIPSWIVWTGLLVAIVLLERLFKWKINIEDHKPNHHIKDPELNLTVIPDKGKQMLRSGENEKPDFGLHIKIIPDKGTQTLKTD